MKHSTTRRTGLRLAGLAALVAGITLHACSASGHVSGSTEITPPFMDPITVTFTLNNDGTTGCQINGGPENANKCVQVTWSDAQGNTTGTSVIQTDGLGAASGPVPPGSVRWDVDIVDCPDPVEEEDDDDSDGGLWDPLRAAQGPGSAPNRKAAALAIRTHVLLGGPITPTAAGDANVAYCFLVQAGSFADAKALVGPILEAGIGAPIPPAVKVVAFASMTADVFGGRYVQAQPGQFQNWSLDFNQGAFQADASTALNYQLNGWDVMEVAIPLSAFDYGGAMGVTYANIGVASYTTDLLAGPVTGSYAFSFSN